MISTALLFWIPFGEQKACEFPQVAGAIIGVLEVAGGEYIIRKALDEVQAKNLNQTRTEQQLRNLIRTLVQNYQTELDTRINNTYFKKMKTKWASYSRNQNLTINTLMRYLPKDLIQYITYHEIAHAIERNTTKTSGTS